MTKKEAIHLLRNTAWLAPSDTLESVEEAAEMAIEALKERPTGKWIEHKHGFWSFVNDKGERDGWVPDYECSECGSRGWKYAETMNFCPSCGADMRSKIVGKHADFMVIDEAVVKGADDDIRINR